MKWFCPTDRSSLCMLHVVHLNEHMKGKHRIFDCDICNFTSSSDVVLKIHMPKAHYAYKCCYCESNLKDENHHKNHIMDVHGFSWKYKQTKMLQI